MSSLSAAIDALHLFGDPTRVRLVALLAHHSLTVADLTGITRLPQSRVSTHLGRLKEAGVVRDQRQGSSTVYSLNDGSMPEDLRRVWTLLAEQVSDASLRTDRERCDALLQARERDAPWPDALAGEMERHYSPGRTWDALARAFIGLVRLGDALDAGSGDGTVAQLLASRARSYTLLDRSERMLAAARARLARTPNVRFLHGDLHEIPAPAGSFDQVLLLNVLTYAERPGAALADVARVLRPGGLLTLVTLDEHPHAAVAAHYGHVHRGFRTPALRRLLQKAGLAVDLCEVTSRERREPQLSVITAFAHKPEGNGASHVH
ncbi:MAG TPA: metalloregulator ArsR/SmtB family transcription factor [Candidatus Eisenbacteria bacterium]|nr:metalloregulator ArsR/SmtB family transcription factor [Candidatus Eisenbacteria bacterium]